MKAGDYIKSGERIYKIINNNGILCINTKYFGLVPAIDFVEEMHGKIQIISKKEYSEGVSIK